MNFLVLAMVIQFPIATASIGSSIGERSFGKFIRRRRDAEYNEADVVIRKFHVTSRITSRFSSTQVVSVVNNGAGESKEVVFEMKIPETAFTTNFTVTTGNRSYVGRVQEKHQAKETYDRARGRGQTAGHVVVSSPVRETETFRVAMNVEAGAEAEFVLTYQEMLFRRRGFYEHRISIRPKQIIDDLKVVVLITEPQGIGFFQVPPIQSNAIDRWVGSDVHNSLAVIDQPSPEHVRTTFSPTREDQIAISSGGIMGDFVVRYDVTHEFNAGELQILGSYFVHHFAPVGLKPARKNVVFVIDVSGSMSGRKLSQTKTALKEILGDMRNDDQFNIVTFSDRVNVWQENGLVPLSDEYRKKSDEFLDTLNAGGVTDINRALLVGVGILQSHQDNTLMQLENEALASMIIMLTDGNPTAGVTDFKRIQQNVEGAVNGQLSIFCLGFGDDVDYEALEVLSLQNSGVARRIFEDADASLQLKGFYDEVAHPVLFNLNINYPGSAVDQNSLTQTTFPILYDGSEIVVAGRLNIGDQTKLQTEVTAISFNETVRLEAQKTLQQESVEEIQLDEETVKDVTQRLWVYLTIKQVLDKMKQTNNASLRAELKQKATALSLEYNFVTKVTSLVVVADEEYLMLESYAEPTVPPPAPRGRRPGRLHTYPLAMSAVFPSFGMGGYMHMAYGNYPPVSGRAYTASWPKIQTSKITLQQPTTVPQQSTTTPQPSHHGQLSEFIVGGFNGSCDVGVKLSLVEPIICFSLPDVHINVNYTLLEIKSPGTAEVKITGSLERLSSATLDKGCWETIIIFPNIPNDITLSRDSYQMLSSSKSCDEIRLTFTHIVRQFTGLVGRLTSFASGLDVALYKDNIIEHNTEKWLLLSSEAGHYQEDLFNP